MPSISRRSSNSPDGHENKTMDHLLIALVVLVSFGLILGGSLFMIRRARRSRKASGSLPSYESSNKNHNRLTISVRDSQLVYSEKERLMDHPSYSPLSPDNVPEIRITFPDEDDKQGRRISGKVVVVEIGEAGVGFVRPLLPESLPSYQQASEPRFNSVDLESIGGLKEKEIFN